MMAGMKQGFKAGLAFTIPTFALGASFGVLAVPVMGAPAAIAQIDKEQLFYLRSRGLGEPSAQRLVIEGFMQELVERFEEGPIREAMSGALERRLSRILD